MVPTIKEGNSILIEDSDSNSDSHIAAADVPTSAGDVPALELAIAPQHTIDSLMSSALVLDDLTMRERSVIPVMLAMPPIMDSQHIQASTQFMGLILHLVHL